MFPDCSDLLPLLNTGKLTSFIMNITNLQKILNNNNARWSVPNDILFDKNPDFSVYRISLGALNPPEGTITARYPSMRRTASDSFYPWSLKNRRIDRPSVGSLPESWDWRNVDGENWVSKTKNQCDCGSCVAFAVAASLESHVKIEKGNSAAKTDISEAGLFFIPGRQCNPEDPRYGWSIPSALDFLIDEGACFEENYPYKPVNQNAELINGSELSLKITGYDSSSKRKQMKRWLCEEGPLITTFSVYEDFKAFWFFGAHGIYSHVTGNFKGQHAVAVVGFDDRESCWICRNSWGTSSMSDGCFRIDYGQCGIDNRMYLIEDVYSIYTKDEISYKPERLRIVDEGTKGWLLTDNNQRLKLLDNNEDARNALRITRRHNRHGFIGRDNTRNNHFSYITEYWTGNSGLSYEPLTKVDCFSYNPQDIIAEDLDRRGWRIKMSKNQKLMAHDMNDALAVLRIAGRHNKVCFIGRNNKRANKKAYTMIYWE